ncbi:MAG: response regulator transcription factor [Dehalococcoidales bacterium]|jgi:DNA-binding response OmpR family regulator
MYNTGGDKMAKILIIDDEIHIVELAKLYLQRDGFQVEYATKGHEGLAMVAAGNPDLVILDIMLPDIDGFEVCRQIRAKSKVPILMLSARREDVDKVVGLELGADDYLAKPFNPSELVARVKAILRRAHAEVEPPQTIDIYGIHIDILKREVIINKEPLKLRTKEFDLLSVFAQNPDIVLSRERLLNQVWGYDYYGETRTVDVHVNHLRDRLEGSPADIETFRGTGYKLVGRKETK